MARTAGQAATQSDGPDLLVTPEVVSRSAAATGAGAAVEVELVVHVVGQVAKPGLVRLKAGARVADAIESAGGATRAADLTAMNLARALVDGEQVFVPKPGRSRLRSPRRCSRVGRLPGMAQGRRQDRQPAW